MHYQQFLTIYLVVLVNNNRWTNANGFLVRSLINDQQDTREINSHYDENINYNSSEEFYDEEYNEIKIFEDRLHNYKPSNNIATHPTMDLITIIWYLSTFVALIAFFVLMACSDSQCGRRNVRKPQPQEIIPPPTPAPSYREFAPPSYDTVIKNDKTRIFIVPVHQQRSSTPIDIKPEKNDDLLTEVVIHDLSVVYR